MSANFTAAQWGRGFASGLPCQAPSEGNAPELGLRDLAKQGSGSGGDAGPREELLGRLQPATGSHLPSEETAPPFAVRPRA
jgi:hypothetical protein